MTYQPFGIAPACVRAPFARADAGGAYGWLTPYLARLAAENERLAARVLLLTRSELHFIALCIALMGDAREDADHLGAFARGLDIVTRRTLIEDACALGQIAFAPGLDKVAGKLAGRIWRPASYLRLAALMREPSARKALAHGKCVSRGDVITLARLPAAYRSEGVCKMIKRRRDLTEVLFAIELVRRVRTDLDDRRILASLEKTEPRNMREWVMKHYERAPFPPAPTGPIMLAGVEAMRPLTCYADLARAAREFENCIRTYLWAVLKGDAYFYRYAPHAGGKGVAIVELRKAPVVGWIVHEALGPDNDALTAVDRAAIVAAFRSVGVPPAPQVVSPNAWFDLD